jgi:hypothetical protein
VIPRLEGDVAEWTVKPQFWCKYAVGWDKWWVKFGVDKRTKIGRIYEWVNEGTATYVGGDPYPIVPVNAQVLAFKIPHYPKTLPGFAGVGPFVVLDQGTVEQTDVRTKKVMHRGIRPRYFTKSLKRELSERGRVGGFRSVTDAAVKRGFRKL